MRTEEIINGLLHTADDHPCCRAILDKAIEALDGSIEWIPVERELPPEGGVAVLYVTKGTYGVYRTSYLRSYIGDGVTSNVTHWAHLPKHPRSLSKELEGTK